MTTPSSLTTNAPFTDCNEKFSTESEYNEHLNSHMSFEHKCPYKDCGQTFSVFKRLDMHCKMTHHTSVEEARSKLFSPVPISSKVGEGGGGGGGVPDNATDNATVPSQLLHRHIDSKVGPIKRR